MANAHIQHRVEGKSDVGEGLVLAQSGAEGDVVHCSTDGMRGPRVVGSSQHGKKARQGVDTEKTAELQRDTRRRLASRGLRCPESGLQDGR